MVITIQPEHDGLRLDRVLTSEIAGHSRSQIQRLIDDGHVRLPRVTTVKANTAVREGDVITVTLPEPSAATPAAEEIPLDVLHQDPDIIVINKPAGMVVHPGAGHGSGTLVNALLHHVTDLSGIGGELRPGIVHRLDKGTSGVMVVAKHDAAHQELSRQFQNREVEKEYVALVWGLVHQRKRIDVPIGRDPVHRQKISTRARRARSAVTRVTWARHVPGLSLLRLAIQTGRTHQIRVHLNAIGHPVVGDSLYGGIHRRVPHHLRAVQHLTRPFLHAERLAFTHPRTGDYLEFKTPLPDDLRATLDGVNPQLLHMLENTVGTADAENVVAGEHGEAADEDRQA
ncbi:MAG TPA: RluA family pseudouridine synthase [Vicinamibacterales bacterium]|nr:RluA family pseudouridine synthase [Vicinamibacterales bacterium]